MVAFLIISGSNTLTVGTNDYCASSVVIKFVIEYKVVLINE